MKVLYIIYWIFFFFKKELQQMALKNTNLSDGKVKNKKTVKKKEGGDRK